jgi:hypothetical protein
MSISRRQALLATLFGATGFGLRSLATGLPVSFFLNPRKAMAGAGDAGAAGAALKQYTIFSTSGNGDPVNANAPGTYVQQPTVSYTGPIIHGGDNTNSMLEASMAQTTLALPSNGPGSSLKNNFDAAKPWAQLQSVPGWTANGGNALANTVFFHFSTNTPVHPDEPQSLSLGYGSGEMLPSLLAEATAADLGTIQPQPVCVGAASPSEAIHYQGAPLPIIPPSALADTLTSPTTGGLQALTNLQALRDTTMSKIYNSIYKTGTKQQQAYIDSLAMTQTEARLLPQMLLSKLANINSPTLNYDAVQQQIVAANILILMKVSPVITIHIPFGGDNHSDPGWATEVAETISGVNYISFMLQQLQMNGLENNVSFMNLNVFGRTLGKNAPSTATTGGRAHNANHHVAVCIGQNFKGGVVGGVAPIKNDMFPAGDYGATGINPATGGVESADGGGGNIAMLETMASFGMTMLAGVGGCPKRLLTNETALNSGSAATVTAALVKPPPDC